MLRLIGLLDDGDYCIHIYIYTHVCSILLLIYLSQLFVYVLFELYVALDQSISKVPININVYISVVFKIISKLIYVYFFTPMFIFLLKFLARHFLFLMQYFVCLCGYASTRNL